MHAMFYSSEADALRAFLKEVEDHGYGLDTFFKVPGGFKVQLYQPRYTK
jgi:hypothetical protein